MAVSSSPLISRKCLPYAMRFPYGQQSGMLVRAFTQVLRPPRPAATVIPRMSKTWTRNDILELSRGYQAACVLAAAADLDLYRHLGNEALPASALATRVGGDLRATAILLDALAGLGLLDKHGDRYAAPAALHGLLGHGGAGSILAMCQHQANCLRRWADLATAVKTGAPPERHASIRGEQADLEAFIMAMNDLAAATAQPLVARLAPHTFHHLLDVGGASGSWTIAFLEACPGARATLFDLPEVVPMARRRMQERGLAARVDLVAGDYTTDAMPAGADLAWVSAIVHQNSREQNRSLFERIQAALVPGGRIVIRDILMDPTRTRPLAGALFAVNMLVGTRTGGTFTPQELSSDLATAGFVDPAVVHADEGMNALLSARKPA